MRVVFRLERNGEENEVKRKEITADKIRNVFWSNTHTQTKTKMAVYRIKHLYL